MAYIRVPIGPRRKKNCESCGQPIRTKPAAPGWEVPYPQILLLEHADTYSAASRGTKQVELCESCMTLIGEAITAFLPDWQPKPVVLPPGTPDWFRQWLGM